MTAVTVVIFHAEPGLDAGPLTRALVAVRAWQAERHRLGFVTAGADQVEVIAGPPDGRSFGARLRDVVAPLARDDDGVVVLGSGAVPLLSVAERRLFVRAAAGPAPSVLANNAYSADIVAIAGAGSALADIPDLATDNALPRWLAERAGLPVTDLRRRWRLGVDIDSPLDLVLLSGRWAVDLPDGAIDRVTTRLGGVRAVTADPGAELLVAGRTSPGSLTWLEGSTASRTRALIEERGLRTSALGQRPPASVLGLLMDRDGPAAMADHLPRLADAALIDTRVLLAHRLGADERAWPTAEDRFASDLLLPEAIADPWLRTLTQAALDASIPVVLGGHTLVGPGLRLALRERRPPRGMRT